MLYSTNDHCHCYNTSQGWALNEYKYTCKSTPLVVAFSKFYGKTFWIVWGNHCELDVILLIQVMGYLLKLM